MTTHYRLVPDQPIAWRAELRGGNVMLVNGRHEPAHDALDWKPLYSAAPPLDADVVREMAEKLLPAAEKAYDAEAMKFDEPLAGVTNLRVAIETVITALLSPAQKE